jgi:hypothetical protein
MKIGIPSTLIAKSSLAKRLALSFAGLSSIAIVGTAGVAAASPSHTMYLHNRGTCQSQYKHFGFKSHNACESYWDKHQHKHHNPHPGNGNGNGNGGQGHGYGGSVGGGVAVVVNGNNNNIVINIYNYFFSR